MLFLWSTLVWCSAPALFKHWQRYWVGGGRPIKYPCIWTSNLKHFFVTIEYLQHRLCIMEIPKPQFCLLFSFHPHIVFEHFWALSPSFFRGGLDRSGKAIQVVIFFPQLFITNQCRKCQEVDYSTRWCCHLLYCVLVTHYLACNSILNIVKGDTGGQWK